MGFRTLVVCPDRVRRAAGRLTAALLLIAAGALVAPAASAQALDDQILTLLDNNCSQLIGQSSFNRENFGDALYGICDIPETSAAGAAGGGGASLQASSLSIDNSVVQQRLQRAREASSDGDRPRASWLFSSFTGNAKLESRSVSGESSGGGLSMSRFDVFATGTYEGLNRDTTRFEDGYDSSVGVLAVGIDHPFSDKVVGGFVAGFRKHDGDFDAGGNFKMTAFEPTVYVSYLPTATTFVQGVIGYSGQSFDVDRDLTFTYDQSGGTIEVTGIASSSTDASLLTGSILAGMDHASGRFTYGPRVGLNYGKTDIDGYVESGDSGIELRVADRSVKSMQATLGFFGSAAYSTRRGVVLPQVNVEYVREFENDASIVMAQLAEDLRGPDALTFPYQTNEPDSSFFNLEAGVAAVLANGIQPYFNLRTMIGNTNFSSFGASVGVRFEL